MRKRRIKSAIIWSVVLAIITWFVYVQFIKQPKVYIHIQEEAVVEETLYMEVSATGTINPIEMVDVGTQVSGKISELFVDYNDDIIKGQILARMDMRNLESSLNESIANLNKAQIVLKQAERALERTEELYIENLIAKVELEKAQDDLNNAKATFNIAEIQMEKNSVNLEFADIVSPIKGKVISKNVEEGQTIAANFSTPTLFTIANDLKEMKIEASVDEADIGQVKQYQQVIFTVDAYPKDEFTGTVTQVQLQPTVVQNVVTYNVIILIENPELKLMPGMTATLIIRTDEKPNSITVPNSALTFEITEEDWKILKKEKYELQRLTEDIENTVWVLKEKMLIETPVEVIFTNGIKTVIISNLIPGNLVITNLKIQIGEEAGGNLFSGAPEH